MLLSKLVIPIFVNQLDHTYCFVLCPESICPTLCPSHLLESIIIPFLFIVIASQIMSCFPQTNWRLLLCPPCSPRRVAGVEYPLLATSWLPSESSLELRSVRTRPFTLWGAGLLSESEMSPSLRSRAINLYLYMLEISLLSLEELSLTKYSLGFGFLYKSIVAAPGVSAYPFPGFYESFWRSVHRQYNTESLLMHIPFSFTTLW